MQGPAGQPPPLPQARPGWRRAWDPRSAKEARGPGWLVSHLYDPHVQACLRGQLLPHVPGRLRGVLVGVLQCLQLLRRDGGPGSLSSGL